MKIEILLLNKTKELYLQQGIADYLQRLKRFNAVELVEVKVKKMSTRSATEVMAHESSLLDRRVTPGGYRIVLDRGGRQLASEKFAAALLDLENRGIATVSFIIGGPLGLDAEQLRKADLILSLSAMTFTHDMTRLILLEQLYRAYTIKAGTSYHK